MALDSFKLAQHLRAARQASGLTQQQIAQALGIPRSAISDIEGGARSITALELSEWGRATGRPIGDFVADDDALVGDPLDTLFHAHSGWKKNARVEAKIRRCALLSREVGRLERIVGRPAPRLESLQFHWPAPAGKWNAISQGRELAEQERRRLDLGSQPIWELTEILGEQGVRVGVEPLPNDISGITLNGSGLGVLIVVNGSQAAPRRTFACAHEYAHALVDRDAPARVSRAAAGDDLLEVRANAFAAHFLMPEVGVREFLRSAGKGDGSRQAQRVPQPDRVAEGTEELAAYRRHAPSAREISAVDVTQIADRFGASYSAAIYQLSNLKFVSEEQAARLRGEEAGVRRFGEMIGIGGEKVGVGPTLTRSIVALGAEALRRELISRRKFLELASEAGLDLEALEPAIAEAGLAGGPVGVELPD